MKRVYVVIEFNAFDAISQGAFENENDAYNAMENWIGNSSANWTVTACDLH